LDNIENNWKQYNDTSVEFNIDFDSTILKFKTKHEGVNEGVNEGVKLKIEGVNEGVLTELLTLYSTIDKNEGKKAVELSKMINKSLSTTERYLKTLKDHAYIEFKGAPKTGGYYLK